MCAACAAERPPAAPPPVTAAPFWACAGGQSSRRAPLPSGWALAVNAQALLRGLTAGTTYRPVNVAALQARSAAAPGPCAPFEIAPSIWITPFCGVAEALALSACGSCVPSRPARQAPRRRGSICVRLGLRRTREGPATGRRVLVLRALHVDGQRPAPRRAQGRDAPLHIVADDEFQVLFQNGSGRPLVQETFWPYDPHKACELDESSGDKPYCKDA